MGLFVFLCFAKIWINIYTIYHSEGSCFSHLERYPCSQIWLWTVETCSVCRQISFTDDGRNKVLGYFVNYHSSWFFIGWLIIVTLLQIDCIMQLIMNTAEICNADYSNLFIHASKTIETEPGHRRIFRAEGTRMMDLAYSPHELIGTQWRHSCGNCTFHTIIF